MAQREIQGIGGPRDDEEPLAWKPWQPPLTGPLAPQTPEGGGVEAVSGPAAARPRMGTDDLQLVSAGWGASLGGPGFDFDALAAGVDRLNAPAAARALGAAGTVAALSEVATACARTTFSPDAIAASLGAFAANLAAAGDRLAAVPGIGLALETFGGVGAVAAGVLTLRDELVDATAQGRGGLSRALGAATGAAKLVGGVAMALGSLVTPLAPVGAALLAAGAALELGKLGWDGREGLKAAAGRASDGVARIISNNGGTISDAEPARVIGNNGARLPAISPGFAWLAG